jgi:hypothetical protein
MGTTHLFKRERADAGHPTDTRRHPAQRGDSAMTPDHIGVVRVSNAWIVHSSLDDDPRPAPAPVNRRIAGRR